MRYLATILLLGFCACQSAEEKFIQGQYDQIEGNWVISSFSVPPNAPDTLKTFFKKGEILFTRCKYYNKPGYGCFHEAEINNVILSMTLSYSSNLFKWNFGVSNSDGFRGGSSKVQQLFDGNWEVLIDGNKMTAKRKGIDKPYLNQATLYKGEVMFTATRK